MITKLDRERSSFSRVLAQLKEIFGKRIAPIQVPIGREATCEESSGWSRAGPSLYGPDDKDRHA